MKSLTLMYVEVCNDCSESFTQLRMLLLMYSVTTPGLLAATFTPGCTIQGEDLNFKRKRRRPGYMLVATDSLKSGQSLSFTQPVDLLFPSPYSQRRVRLE